MKIFKFHYTNRPTEKRKEREIFREGRGGGEGKKTTANLREDSWIKNEG